MFDNTVKIFWISLATSLIVSIIVSLLMVVFIGPNLPFLKEDKTVKSEKVEVPLIEGMDFERAKLILSNKGLLLFVESEKTSQTEVKGVVLSQSPLSGTMVDKTTPINVITSAGPEIAAETTVLSETKTVLPYYTGLNIDEVKRDIIKLKMKIGSVTYIENDKYKVDVVVSTEPEGGTELPEGSSVNMNVSKGSVTVTMPNVNSLSKGDALEKIRQAGLTVSEVINITDVEFPFDIVIKQSPESGAKVRKGTGVKIWMNTERK